MTVLITFLITILITALLLLLSDCLSTELETSLTKAEEVNTANTTKNAELVESLRKATTDLNAHLATCIPNKFASERTIADVTLAKATADKRIAELEAKAKADNETIATLGQQLADATKNKGISTDQLAVLTTKDNRIAELEKLLASAVKDKTASADQLAALNQQIAEMTASNKAAVTTIAGMSVAKAAADKKITEVEKQLADAANKGTSGDQLAALAAKDSRIAALELQIKNTGDEGVTLTALKKQQLDDMLAESVLKDKMLADKDKALADALQQAKKDTEEASASSAELRQHLLISMKELADAKQALVDVQTASTKDKHEREGLSKQLADMMVAKTNAGDHFFFT